MELCWRLPSEFLGAFIRLVWLKPISPGSFSFPVIFMPPPRGSIDSQVLTYSPLRHPSAVTRLAHHNQPSAFISLSPPLCYSLFRKLLLTFLLLSLLGPLLLARCLGSLWQPPFIECPPPPCIRSCMLMYSHPPNSPKSHISPD